VLSRGADWPNSRCKNSVSEKINLTFWRILPISIVVFREKSMKIHSPNFTESGFLTKAVCSNGDLRALRMGSFGLSSQAVALTGACLFGLSGVSLAAPGSTWLGGGIDNNWATAGNWDITPSGVGSWDLIYQGVPSITTSKNNLNLNGSTVTLSSIRFTNDKSVGFTSQFLVPSQGTRYLTLADSAVVSTTSTLVIDDVLEDVISSALVLAGASSFDLGRDHNMTLSGTVTGGGGSITKTGLGDMLLSGTTTLGGLTINQGSVGFNTTSIPSINSMIVDIGSSASTGTLRTSGVTIPSGVSLRMGGNAAIQANLNSMVTFSNPVFNVPNPAVTTPKTINLSGGSAGHTGTDTIQGVIQNNSSTGIVKLNVGGLNTWVLEGNNSYTGATTISGSATLIVNGSIDAASPVTVGATTTLGGSGLLGAVSGAGSIAPGNSPGILSVTTVDPSAGMDFNFEFTGSNPNYASPTSSINDVLKLTAAANPFLAALGVNNTVNIYFNVPSILSGDMFTGGFFTSNSSTDFIADVSGGTYNFYQQNPLGGVTYGGIKYDLLAPGSFTVSTTAVTGGGRVTMFTAVPEPVAAMGTLCFLASGFLLRRRP
jgi:autotransporter-associated beta strand protein